MKTNTATVNFWDIAANYYDSYTINLSDYSIGYEVNKNKEKKELPIPAKKSGLFSKVGVEPTFYPNIKFPDEWMGGINWINTFNVLVDEFINMFKGHTNHEWINDTAYNDGETLEVPSNKEYETLPVLMVEYTNLIKVMKEYGFAPSSIIQPDSDGGCHINFDLSDRCEKYGEDIVELFCRNVIGFLNQNPTAVWGFIHYEDTESSNIYLAVPNNVNKNTGKGKCLTVRYKYNYSEIEYIEMRGFSMPRTIAEFKFHIDYCNKLLKYIWNETIKKPDTLTFKATNSQEELMNYTLSKANKEFESLLTKIGVNVETAIRFNKFTMIRKRIQSGKSYLS